MSDGSSLPALASAGGWTGTGLVEVSDDLTALDRGGRWMVVMTFEGAVTCARFAEWRPGPPAPAEVGEWQGPEPGDWLSSLTESAYTSGVADIRERIAAGDVYQVNLCRTLQASLPDPRRADPAALASRLDRVHPAPFSALLRIPELSVVSASPELFLHLADNRLTSGPIKGTARRSEELTDKDRAENTMIVDLVRNDLARVCLPGTVTVPALHATEEHPGLVHLVSRVSGDLPRKWSWAEVMKAVFPPGSVTGAPKLAALGIIDQLEPMSRGPYCGAIGWVDADRGTAELAVAIRTFWFQDGDLLLGTGAGITWGSRADAEWRETVLKAERLIQVAAR